MNRAFEDVYHKPVVITCPPVGSNQNSNSSSDINVAALQQQPSDDGDRQRPQIDPFDSSDSCTSILLGYVDNRSRKLVKDIKQCKDVADDDKRKKLVTLLTRLDHLRKLLEEIVRNSSLNLEPFYRSVLEVETEKKEILHDPDANKENMKKRAEQLNKREQTVKSQEMKLEKKIRQLFLKEQDKVDELRGDNTFESVTSETITSDNIDQPVKILIEVKNGGKIRKSHQVKKGQTIQTKIVGAEYKHKTSVGSTTSTAYRSPPPTFHTDFTNILSKEADAKATKLPINKPVQQTDLAQYITRLLGMSQQSVDQLGVSTGSSIATPSDSVIEVAENMPAGMIDSNHLNRVQAKINDSIRLAKEVDDSFKQAKKYDEMKNVVKRVRDTKEQEIKLVNERQMPTKRQTKLQHSDVVKTKSPEKSKKIKQKTDTIGQGHTNEATIEANIPENTKRIIADLTKQIEKVRQDKQKLMEKTLSSAHSSHSSSGKEFDLTEYRDFAPPKSKTPADENVCSSQASDAQSLPGHFIDEEQPKNLINTKQIGISFSRDSGIGSSRPASRPVTSTDFRISPDIKPVEKTTIVQAQKVVGTDLPIDPSAAGLEDTGGKSVDGGFTRKSARPPISLKR